MSNFETWWEREGQEFLYALNTTTDDDIKLVAEVAWKNGAYCAEQAEQEPVAWKADGQLFTDKNFVSIETPVPLYAAPVQPVKQEPVAWTYEEVKSAFEYLKLQVKGPDDKWTVGESCTYFGFFRHGIDAATQRRTAPVRTKDLTDDEIEDAVGWTMTEQSILDCRAVIAADREKNK